jgi:ribosome maturation factor RimP
MKSITKSDVEEKVLGIAQKVLLGHGLRPVDVDCRVGPRSLVRIYIERLRAEAGQNVSVEDCAEASRELGTHIDESFFMGPFDLEVSSPGLDRRLRLDSDFTKVVGDEVKLVLLTAVEGFGSKVRGRLVKVEEDGVIVLVAGKPEHKFAYENIKQANRVWEFNKLGNKE